MNTSKESIFKNILKSFLRGFFSIFGIFFAVILFMMVIGIFIGGQDTAKKSSLKILPDLEGNTDLLSTKTPVVLQIKLHGIIGEGQLTAKAIQSILIESRKTIFQNNRVKAILLHLQTPGGSVNDSDGIYQALVAYKKKYNTPIFAYVDGMCASGGCYISAAADKIYANPVSIIGSVGVLLGPFFNVSDALNKIGISALTLTDGKDKDMMNPLRKWKDTEADHLKKIGAYFYERFVNIMVENRKKLSKDLLINKYGAQVFDSKQAETLGYIDVGNSSYEETLLALLKQTNIDEKKPYQIIQLHTKKRWLPNLLQENSLLKGKIQHIIQIDPPLNKDPFSYLYIPGKTSYGKNIYH